MRNTFPEGWGQTLVNNKGSFYSEDEPEISVGQLICSYHRYCRIWESV